MDKTDACAIIDKEINGLFSKALTPQTVDLLFKLTNIRALLQNGEYGAYTAPQGQANDKKYDRNINYLLDEYIAAKKSKIAESSTTALGNLLGELSDLVIEIYNTANTTAERDIVDGAIKKMTMH